MFQVFFESNCINCYISLWQSVHIHYFLPQHNPFYITYTMWSIPKIPQVTSSYVFCFMDDWQCFSEMVYVRKIC